MAFHKMIGIDLGTTYSAVSIWDHDRQEIVVIPSAIGFNTIPSVVGLDLDCNIIVGAPAQNKLITHPNNTVIEVKREMGAYEREPNAHTRDFGELRRIRFRGRNYFPQEISAFILMELKRQAENYVGEPIHDAVITVPVYFKKKEKDATADAAAMARLNVKLLLNEPTAAAVCFGVDKVHDGKKHIYVVYDLGGGICDVSIIECTDGNIRVVGTGGDPVLGGGDFDDRITGYVLQQIQAKHGVDLSRDPAIWARIKCEAEARKRELSAATSTMVNLPFLTAQLSVSIRIARTTFEALVEDLLMDSMECLEEAINSAYHSNGVKRDEIEYVLLVGGSTRISCIRKMLAERLSIEQKNIRCDFNPDEAVSRGAAIVARRFNPSDGYVGKEIIIHRMQSYYSLLGVPWQAMQKEIRDSYNRKLKELRERQCTVNDFEEQRKLQDQLKEINLAYETLLRPTSREEYDRVNAQLIALEAGIDADASEQFICTTPLVFISAKSADFKYAQQVYELLTSRGLPTFFSQESLIELGDADFRRAIDRALDQSKHMIVVTSSRENAESPWVQAEWGFFINEKRSGRKNGNLITIVVGSLQPADLPPGLRYYQVMFSKPRELEKMLRYLIL